MLCSIQFCAMIADTKALTLAELEKEERKDRRVDEEEWWGEPPNSALALLVAVPWRTTGQGCTATSVWKWSLLKRVN
jgi:hypothetical protein